MEKIYKLPMENDTIKINKELKLHLNALFSGCRVNMLLGAGFSANILGVLNNNEIIFEELRKYNPSNKSEKSKLIILTAYMYWSFFKTCIYPIANISIYSKNFSSYIKFGEILFNVFSERSNPVLDRQFNIFTTNYDPILELIFDRSRCICNDGFEGRIHPAFATQKM